MVISKPLELLTGGNDTVVNSCFIAEVLSKSIQNYDRIEKFSAYRTLETFQAYVLVDQYRVHVEHYRKTTVNQWLFSEYHKPKATVVLSNFDLHIQIVDLYEGINFNEDV